MNTKRKQIIDAAHDLFIHKGFTATSIQDILDKSGVAKGTFYNYFNSKNECLIAILDFIAEEIDKRRRELLIGKEATDEDVFIQQMAIRMNMNKQNNLMAVFESVSFSEDVELKAFMDSQYRNELQWISGRLVDLLPAKAMPFTLDYAVILVGIVHHMMHVWKISSSEEIQTDNFIRYSYERIKLMVDKQSENETVFLPKSWFDYTEVLNSPSLEYVTRQLEGFRNKLNNPKQRDLIDFLLLELQEKSPRNFLIESVLMSLENSVTNTDHEIPVKNILQKIWQLI